MMTKIVEIPGNEIADWDSLHTVFKKNGFPDFYGRNMDALIDCMSNLDDPEDMMTSVKVGKGGIIIIKIENFDQFQARYSEIYKGLISCISFVNSRQISSNREPILAFMPIEE